jgi:hypothetical protein
LPENITTLAGVPRTETIVEDGFNKKIERKEEGRPDDRRELFYHRKGSTEYRFVLFHSNAAAIAEYEWAKKHHPVFQETTEHGLAGRIHYTEEPRADPEGGSEPLGYYISRADFRLHNLYICVETTSHSKPQNDKLADAVKELGRMLQECPSLKQ